MEKSLATSLAMSPGTSLATSLATSREMSLGTQKVLMGIFTPMIVKPIPVRYCWIPGNQIFLGTTDNNETTAWVYHHVYVGEETVEGIKTAKYEISVDGEDDVFCELWVDSDGNIVKGGSEGEYATGEMAAMYSFYLVYAFPLFAYQEEYADAFINNDFDGYGWNLTKRSSDKQNFGAGNVNVERYVFEYDWATIGAEYVWELANIKGKYIFTALHLAATDGTTLDMEAETIIPF